MTKGIYDIVEEKRTPEREKAREKKKRVDCDRKGRSGDDFVRNRKRGFVNRGQSSDVTRNEAESPQSV